MVDPSYVDLIGYRDRFSNPAPSVVWFNRTAGPRRADHSREVFFGRECESERGRPGRAMVRGLARSGTG